MRDARSAPAAPLRSRCLISVGARAHSSLRCWRRDCSCIHTFRAAYVILACAAALAAMACWLQLEDSPEPGAAPGAARPEFSTCASSRCSPCSRFLKWASKTPRPPGWRRMCCVLLRHRRGAGRRLPRRSTGADFWPRADCRRCCLLRIAPGRRAALGHRLAGLLAAVGLVVFPGTATTSWRW